MITLTGKSQNKIFVKEELNLPCPYKVRVDSSKNTYHFNTVTGAEYEVLFISENAIFQGTVLQSFDCFTIAINKIKQGNVKADGNIKLTIREILYHFFLDENRILTYVFESTDNRNYSRKRLFRIWKRNHDFKNEILKKDATIPTDEMEYECGLLFHKNHMAGKLNIDNAVQEIKELLIEK